jgi:DNA-binding HxlR family transcriptional regulator
MPIAKFQDSTCSVARSLSVLGERWTLLILRCVLQDTNRFDRLQEILGVTRSVLTARLRHLVDEGVLERRAYSEHPPRYEYHVTDKGRDLWPVLMQMVRWGDRYYPDPDGRPLVVTHTGCGGEPDAWLRCETCGEPLELATITATVRPSLREVFAAR